MPVQRSDLGPKRVAFGHELIPFLQGSLKLGHNGLRTLQHAPGSDHRGSVARDDPADVHCEAMVEVLELLRIEPLQIG